MRPNPLLVCPFPAWLSIFHQQADDMRFLSPSRLLSVPSSTLLFHGKETVYTVAGLAGVLTLFRLLAFVKRRNLPLPPGPDRLPLLGNLLNFPQSGWLNAFCSWQKQFGGLSSPLLSFPTRHPSHSLDPGDIVYAYVLGDHVVVLNSFNAANDLLTKSGATYSNRPDCTMTEDLCVPTPPCTALLPLNDACIGWVGGVSIFSCSNQERSSLSAEI